MISFSNGIISGGIYTQYNDNRVVSAQSGFDRLLGAVAPGAFHNSGDRFDPPKCHPNTRVAVMQKIMNWVLGLDNKSRSSFVLWLNGAAGAGKSAIAQSIAEQCFDKGYLVGSFFFSRLDSRRNHQQHLFPTVAYQIALMYPEVKEKMTSLIERDPLIFTRSLSVQFSTLIVEPFQALSSIKNLSGNAMRPRLIIIDGLDECLDRKVQLQILDTIFDAVILHQLPFIFLISSRPEHDISNKFKAPEIQSVLTRLFLDDSYLPDIDIEIFLRDKFKQIVETHPFKKFIPSAWPADSVVDSLIQKSSGQFVYASTVIRFLESSRHRPHHQLEVIQNLRPTESDQPFAELDALYTHIFSCVDDIARVDLVLALDILLGKRKIDILERILFFEPGEVEILFCDLSSVINLKPLLYLSLEEEALFINVLHASLPDFLLDKFRSKAFHLDLDVQCAIIMRKCVQFLASEPFTGDFISEAHLAAIFFFSQHIRTSLYSIDLENDLYSVSLPLWDQRISTATGISASNSVYSVNYWMIGPFLHDLSLSESEGTKRLYAHHLQSYHDVLKQHLQVYFLDPRLTLLLALIDFAFHSRQEGYLSFHPEGLLFAVDSTLLNTDSKRLGLLSCDAILQIKQWESYSFPRVIHRYITDRNNPEQFRLNGSKFADVARFCLTYFSNDSLASLSKINSHSKEYVTFMKGQNQMFDFDFDLNSSEDTWRKKYSLAVKYASYFLQRASPSEQLVECCRNAALSEFSKKLPEKSDIVRGSIDQYIKRTEVERS